MPHNARLARLFVESEYSQEKLAELLAKRWGKEVTQQWVSYRIRFGRFLAFFTTDRCEDSRLPADLTEWKFRKLWEATEAGGNYSGHRANTEAAKQDELRGSNGRPERRGVATPLRGEGR